jgi:predicted aspartyl protease
MKSRAISRSLCFFVFLAVLPSVIQGADTDNPSTNLAVRTVNGYLMVVHVSINGQGPFDFLVDTGTNSTLVDPGLAAELHLKAVDRMALATLADAAPVVRYYADTIQAGQASVAHLELLGAPLTEIRAVDSRIRGVLGMNFLLQFSFLLDYRHQRMAIFPLPDSVPVPAGRRVNVQINDSRILIPVASQSSPQGSWNLVLDSGIGNILLFQSRVRSLASPCVAAPCIMQVATNGSNYAASAVVIPEMMIAERSLINQSAIVLRNDLLKTTDPQDGLLPASLFRSVFFDRSNATLVVESR